MKNKYLRNNLKSLILLQIIYSLFVSYLYIPLVKFMFKQTITLTKVFALTPETLKDYFLSFYTIAFVIIVLISFSFLLIFEMSMIMNMVFSVKDKQLLSVKELFVNSLPKHNKNLFSFKPLYILYIVISFFVLGTLYVNPYLTILDLPTFLSSELVTNDTYGFIFMILFILSIIIVFLLLYVFVIMANVRVTFKEACKRSISYVFNKPINAFITLLTVIALYLVQSLLLSLVDGALYFIATRHMSLFFSYALSAIVAVLATLAIPTISIVFRYIFFSFLTHNYFEDYDIFDVDYVTYKKGKKSHLRNFVIAFSIIAVVFIRVALEGAYPYNEAIQVVAHRGESTHHIENTLEAIQTSIDQDIKVIEIDVVLTKDNEVVVFHDLNLKRLTGDERRVSEVNLSELQTLTLTQGSLTSSIPTLEEVLSITPSDVSLLIELKPDGDNYNELATRTEILISSNDKHLIQSFSIPALESIKRINPNRACGFIMIIGEGGFVNYEFADFYTVEESYIGRPLINQIHAVGKKAYVWTINDEEKVTKCIALNADAIITDRALYFTNNLDVSEELVYYYRLQTLLLIDHKFLDYENLFVEIEEE